MIQLVQILHKLIAYIRIKGAKLEITYNNKKVQLQKKDRQVGSEAPAIRITMDSGELKVIGMMADKVQVFITLPFKNSLSKTMEDIILKHHEKSLIYLISSEKYDKDIPVETSSDFKDLSLKMGVNIDDTLCAKSIFIINKDGEIVYKEIVSNIDDEFDTQKFDTALDEAIKFKKKGHTHENWMG
jgi:thiol peroxidase